jgi:3-hydroxyacyl-CoA dehydrogenase
LAAVADSDLVIEAVFEDLALKSKLAAELGMICRPRTLLASNTSSLDIDILAKASLRPDRFLGVHFFSPAHIMRLVEVVRGRETNASAIDTVVALIRNIGKTPVVCGVCFGFIGNRMAEPYLREADALMLEGVSPAEIDAVAEDPEMLGMAMGPCRMMDLAGLDIGSSIITERAATTNLMDDASYRCIIRTLAQQGHLGQKTGRGIYRYEGRKATETTDTARLIEELATRHAIKRRSVSRQEILERLLYPLINEGYEVLREGIADSSADIDTVFTAGFGFPVSRGGPMVMAEAIGAKTILERINAFAAERGNQFNYWTPSPLLIQHARAEEVRS